MAPDSSSPPIGCVVLVFTDVEGSTALWEADPAAMRQAIGLHNDLLRQLLREHGGYEVKTEGDAFMVAFESPAAAVAWCLQCQGRLLELDWPPSLLERAEATTIRSERNRTVRLFRGLRVRMGVHLGSPDCVPDPTTGRMDYFGPVVNRAARVSGTAHGGQVLLSASAYAAVLPELSSTRARRLGTFHLKGLSSPETLYEVLPEPLAERTFPPPRGQAPHRVTLPRPVTGCLGREAELSELEAVLAAGERLVTLLGPGGIGKTRLSIELGHRLARQAECDLSAVPFCDLTRAREAAEIVELVARAIDCPPGATTLEGLLEAVGARLAERAPLLVILDNFEQVVSHAAETVGRWMRASPATRFLVTSREPLGLEGERALRLSSLGTDDGALLFVERALSARAGLALGPDQRPVVEQIVRRLDGIPLALELAAGRVGVLSIEQLEAQLSQRFKLLSSKRRDLTARQATLRGAIDWSWALLSEAERTAMAQLAIFHGWTMASAEAVVETQEWLPDLMQALVDRSMVQASERAGDIRFHMLESVREYALEQVAARARERHAAYFARLAETRFTGAFLDDDRVDLDALEVEKENFTTALDCPSLPADDKLRLVVALCGHAYTRAPLEELYVIATRGEAIAREASCLLSISRTLTALGICQWLRGELDAALQSLARALDAAERAGSPAQKAIAMNYIANVYTVRGEMAEGEKWLVEALQPARACGDPSVEARLLGNIGQGWFRQFRFDECLEVFSREVELTRGREQSLERAFAESNLGGALMGLNRYREAREAYERALAIYAKQDHFRFESMTRCSIAYVRVMTGEGSLALQDLMETLERARRFGVHWGIAHSLVTIGVVRLESGQHDEALAALEEGLAVARQSGDRSMLSMNLAYRAAAHAMRGDLAKAEADMTAVRELMEGGHTTFLYVLEGLLDVARAKRAGGDAEAQAHLAKARERLDDAVAWMTGQRPPPTTHSGSRFPGVALPFLRRALENSGSHDSFPASARIQQE